MSIPEDLEDDAIIRHKKAIEASEEFKNLDDSDAALLSHANAVRMLIEVLYDSLDARIKRLEENK